MKYIRTPAPIAIMNPDGTPAMNGAKPLLMPFSAFVSGTLLNDASWGKTGLSGIRASVCIDIALRDAERDGVDHIALTDEQHEALNRVLQNPEAGYSPWLMRQVLPFADAIEQATSAPPDPVEKPEPSKPRKKERS